MSFLDPYDIARSTTPTPTQPQQPTLDEEVNQVIGQLGSWWGGFRKQSQIALDTARKDLGSVVIQAQKELSKLTAAEEPSAAGPSTSSDTAATGAEPGTEATDESTSADSSGAPTPRSGQPTSDGIQVGLLSRLQAAFPPSIVTTVRDHIPNTIRQASENIDVNQIRTNLLSELQRVQGLTLAQAEEYAHKSEEFLKEAVKEAGDVLREAVKVIPPEDGAGGVAASAPGLLWDGTDIWTLPSTSTIEGTEAESSTQAQAQGVSKARAAHTAVASRAEALLKRLKHDPEILRHDPGTEASAEFAKWKAAEVDAVEGGLGSDAWKAKINAALDDPADGAGLKSVKDILVPSELTEEAFWLRFLFRSSQIRAEEEKRKALIQGSTDADEDFSWEDDDEDADEEEGNEEEEDEEEEDDDEDEEDDEDEDEDEDEEEEEAPKKPIVQSKAVAQPSLAPPGAAGLRVGSSDSFDMVSSVTTSATGDEKPQKVKGESDGDDSDWE